jgi:hypothetical protein
MITSAIFTSRRLASTSPQGGKSYECFLWGKGGEGALGTGLTKDQYYPKLLQVQDDGGENLFQSLATGASHSAVIDAHVLQHIVDHHCSHKCLIRIEYGHLAVLSMAALAREQSTEARKHAHVLSIFLMKI